MSLTALKRLLDSHLTSPRQQATICRALYFVQTFVQNSARKCTIWMQFPHLHESRWKMCWVCLPHIVCLTNANDQCILLLLVLNTLKSFLCSEDRVGDRIPYTQDLAYKDFAPYVYLDGFHGDEKTRGTNNKRAWEVPAADNSSLALEVVLPKGCVTAECAMQAKSMLLLPTESATLKFRYPSISSITMLN